MISPSGEQSRAIHSAAQWFKHGNKPFFYLGGYAGSGKTTLVPFIMDACGIDPDSTCYGSYTGKASLVMRRKGMRGATTLHQLIYRIEDTGTDGHGNIKLRFVKNRESDVQRANLVVVDECSMVDEKIALDLLSFGTKVLVLGDPGQLEPVQGNGYFTAGQPDFFLKEIHRQALENPIIRYSIDIRENRTIPYCDEGAFRKIKAEHLDPDELLIADQVLTGKNATRRELNQMMLEQAGYNDLVYPVQPGMKLIVLRNDWDMGIINGMLGETTEPAEAEDFVGDQRYMDQWVRLDDARQGQPFKLSLFLGHFEDTFGLRTEKQRIDDAEILKNARMYGYPGKELDYGYAITVHKSQGSQWDNVLLYDDGMLSWDPIARRRWMYTAVTRAAETMTIVV